MEHSEEMWKELEERINRIEILCQDFGKRIDKLENPEYGTGVFLDGCTEADAEYIAGKPIKKEGE